MTGRHPDLPKHLCQQSGVMLQRPSPPLLLKLVPLGLPVMII